jgi:type IV secretion system protein VirD4
MSAQPELYRKPFQPGYLGSYNWPAMALGCILFLLTNWASTEYIAMRFEYQPALGSPLFQVGHTPVYPPFAWFLWGLHNITSHDPAVRRPLGEGIVILFFGCAVSIFLYFGANSLRSRRLSANAEHLHGSARWATDEDIRETGLLDASQGVYVGGWKPNRWSRLHYLRHDGPEHVLVFAPTRSGKGVSLVIPTLLAWNESAIIYDIKGENWAMTAGFRSQQGHICFRFCPVEETYGSRFNPLAEVRLFTDRDVSDAQNMAEILGRTPGEHKPSDPHWEDTAVSIISGMILHVCYEAKAEGRTASLADLTNVFSRSTDLVKTLKEISEFCHDPKGEAGWPGGIHPVVRKKAIECLIRGAEDLKGVLSTINTALQIYCDPLILRNMITSDFAIQDLVNHERPVSLYLVVPNSDRDRLAPLMRLIFTTIIHRLTETMVFHGGTQQKNRHKLLFLIDEFPSLSHMKVFANALSYMAGYGLKAYLITQDIRQIVDAYGPNESIVSNCHVRVAFTPNQQETCELLSKMTGTQTIQKATYNFSGKRNAPVMNHVNASVENVERPLMTPDEVSRLKAAKKRGKDDTERIVAPGKMLIFVGGQHPILGTQMLYFSDPTLKAWAEIPPPTELVSIQGGNTVPLPVTVKVNRSTKEAGRQPENAERLTEIERAFIEVFRQQREVYDYAG